MKIQFNEYVLCAGAAGNELPQQLQIFQNPLVQEIRYIGASSLHVCQRGNLRTRIQFQVKRRHETPLAAALFLLVHASNLTGTQGDLVFHAPEHQGGVRFTIPHAVLEEIRSEMEAVHTTHTYFLLGGTLDC